MVPEPGRLGGEVTVELVVPAHWRGVAADPVVVPAGRDVGELVVRCADGAIGPFDRPAVVRAAMPGPVLAETRLELVRTD